MKFDRYIKNLSYDNEFVYSYKTKVAEIDHAHKLIKTLGYWSMTTTKHINYAARILNYKKI